MRNEMGIFLGKVNSNPDQLEDSSKLDIPKKKIHSEENDQSYDPMMILATHTFNFCIL
jgi:hypothetical protein